MSSYEYAFLFSDTFYSITINWNIKNKQNTDAINFTHCPFFCEQQVEISTAEIEWISVQVNLYMGVTAFFIFNLMPPYHWGWNLKAFLDAMLPLSLVQTLPEETVNNLTRARMLLCWNYYETWCYQECNRTVSKANDYLGIMLTIPIPICMFNILNLIIKAFYFSNHLMNGVFRIFRLSFNW